MSRPVSRLVIILGLTVLVYSVFSWFSCKMAHMAVEYERKLDTHYNFEEIMRDYDGKSRGSGGISGEKTPS